MNTDAVRTIRPAGTVDACIRIPSSKSYTNRALIVAALADGVSVIVRPSPSEDSEHVRKALESFCVPVTRGPGEDRIEISGTNGKLCAPREEIFIGNAGTAMRFLTSLASIAGGTTTITGDELMRKRPMADLLDALRMAGVRCSSENGFPPVTVQGGHFVGGRIDIEGAVSSQFISSILLAAPYAKRPVTLHVRGKLSSMPYVDMSIHVMRSFGALVDSIDTANFRIDNQQQYIGQEFTIEADASGASYFFAAAAICGGRVLVAELSRESLQGDIRFLDILEEMGCGVGERDNGIEVRGTGQLAGIEADMNDIPDCVPTLAVMAAFADGPTTIGNVAHLVHKESNRLRALAVELSKMGARVDVHEDGLTITPKPMHGAAIETYNDHRIAMSFAVAGLRQEGISVRNPDCVAKSFPGFWDQFAQLEPKE